MTKKSIHIDCKNVMVLDFYPLLSTTLFIYLGTLSSIPYLIGKIVFEKKKHVNHNCIYRPLVVYFK